MLRAMHTSTLVIVAILLSTTHTFAQHHAGDVAIEVIDNTIVTGVVENEQFTPERVFPSEFGDTGIFNFTDEPGFDAEDGTFPPQTLVGFNILAALGEWNGAGFDASEETLTVSFGNLQVTTGAGYVEGFGLRTDAGGGWHRHLGFTLNDVSEQDSGIYLLELELWHESRTIENSDSFFIVFNFQRSEQEHDAAIQFVEDMIGGDGETVCPDAAVILRGIETGGDFADLCESDESDWSFQPDAFAATIVAPINIELTGTTTIANPSELSFEVESAATEPGVVQRIELFNFAAELWEGFIYPNIPQDDSVFEAVIDTDAADYVANDGAVRARISFTRPAGVPPFWMIALDRAAWDVVE